MSKSGTSTAARPARRRIAGERTGRRPDEQHVRPVQPAATPPPAPEPSSRKPGAAEATGKPSVPRPPRRGPSNLVLGALAVVAAAVVAVAAHFAVPAWAARGVEQTDSTAPSVAERAAAAILSYDYTSLDHDEKVAAGYMTPTYRKKYEHTFRLVKSNAPRLKAKVTARVLGSGVSQSDADHAHVLLFVDQTTRSTANGGKPQVALNRVMLDMLRQNGVWRVNGITSY